MSGRDGGSGAGWVLSGLFGLRGKVASAVTDDPAPGAIRPWAGPRRCGKVKADPGRAARP